MLPVSQSDKFTVQQIAKPVLVLIFPLLFFVQLIAMQNYPWRDYCYNS